MLVAQNEIRHQHDVDYICDLSHLQRRSQRLTQFNWNPTDLSFSFKVTTEIVTKISIKNSV